MTTLYLAEGQKTYVGGIITADGDLIGTGVKIGFGPYSTPPAYTDAITPDVVEVDGSTVTVKHLVDADTDLPDGNWYVWIWLADNPEVEPVRIEKRYAVE